MIERILDGKEMLALIIRASYKREGIEFFTTDDDTLQMGYMFRPAEYNIAPHRHNAVPRTVYLTQEVLVLRSGKVRVDFYNNDEQYLRSTILNKDDVILLSSGGHGFTMLEPSEIIEVKQGPYGGEKDKVRFSPVAESFIKGL